jgi:hypothetical protein
MSPVALLNSQAGLLAKTARFHRTNAEASFCQCAAYRALPTTNAP